MHIEWARSLRDQCAAAGVPFFLKQWGEWRPWQGQALNSCPASGNSAYGTPYKSYTSRELEGGQVVELVGKKLAGRVLDGRTWDEFPA